MTGVAIPVSSFPAAALPLTGTEQVPLVQGGITKVTTSAALAAAASSSTVPINSQVGTSYALVIGDAGQCVEMNNGSANTLTVPANASVAFPIGTTLLVRQMGAGATTIAAAGGVTLRSPGGSLQLSGQYGLVSLHKRATNEWCITGNLA